MSKIVKVVYSYRLGVQSEKFTPELVAPCGMNCGICKAYLAYSRGVPNQRGKATHCSGCLPRSKNCYIKRGCKNLRQNVFRFCFECEQMPCENLKRLDKRYRSRYNMSMVENLKEIKANGIEKFLENQRAKYRCPRCSDAVSVHDGQCYSCKQISKS